MEATKADLGSLVELSRRFGSDPDWVLEGGGNTSFKTAGHLYVKASGFRLGTIGPDGFCDVDRGALDAIWKKAYPQDRAAREDAVLADLMAARVPGETKRPSVETLMHGFFPQAYVVHTHPAVANGLTCGRAGEAAFRRLFAAEGIWVPFVDPGYVLAKTVRDAFIEFAGRVGAPPRVMFMQNHGILVAADTPEEILAISGRVAAALAAEVARVPASVADFRARAVDARVVAEVANRLAGLDPAPKTVLHRADAASIGFAAGPEAFFPISASFSPDHIVYAGHEYLRVDGPEDLAAAWGAYAAKNGNAPRIVLVRDAGVFALGADRPEAARALSLYTDSCRVASYSLAFGGPSHMEPDAVAFIRNWEVEKYRSGVASGNAGGGAPGGR